MNKYVLIFKRCFIRNIFSRMNQYLKNTFFPSLIVFDPKSTKEHFFDFGFSELFVLAMINELKVWEDKLIKK